MTPMQLFDYVQKKCKEVVLINYSIAGDRATFIYKVNGNRYEILVVGVSDIKTTKEANDFVQMIQSNINYHEQEQEQEKE